MNNLTKLYYQVIAENTQAIGTRKKKRRRRDKVKPYHNKKFLEVIINAKFNLKEVAKAFNLSI